MPQTDTAIKNAKPRPYKQPDEKVYIYLLPLMAVSGGGLNIALMESEKPLSMGTYPFTLLKQARNKRDNARSKLSEA